MFKEKIEKVTALIKKEGEGNNKKKIENMVVFLIILIITIIAINVIWKDDTTEEKETSTDKVLAQADTSDTVIETSESDLEEKLETILSKINGVGKVSVLITYSESSELVLVYNESSTTSSTTETDSGGGSREIQETDSNKEVAYQDENGESVPITEKIVNPKIEGAIIAAVGANNATIKANIIQAVEAATGLATHKIQVFEMKE